MYISRHARSLFRGFTLVVRAFYQRAESIDGVAGRERAFAGRVGAMTGPQETHREPWADLAAWPDFAVLLSWLTIAATLNEMSRR